MDADAQALILPIIGPTPQNCVARPIAGVSVIRIGSEKVGQVKVANGLVHRRRSNPVHIGLAGAEVQLAARSRANIIPVGVADIPEKHPEGAAALAGEGDRGHIGGGGGDGDVVEGVGGAQFDGVAEPCAQRLEV